jgi:hypothetical protein
LKAQSEPEYITGGINITMQGQTTRTTMPAFGEVFRNDRSAPGTYLAGIPGINQYHPPTGIFRLVCENTEKIPPACIGDTFSKTMILDHVLNLEVFGEDRTVPIDQLPGDLMMKVAADVSYLLVFSAQERNCFPTAVATLLPAGYSLLGFNQSVFGLSQEAGIINEFAIGSCQKRLQPHIDTDDIGAWRKGHAFRSTREYPIPPVILSFQGERLDFAIDRPVQFNLNRAHFGKNKPIFSKSETKLGIGKTVVAVKVLEAGITGLSKCRPAVESLERFINPVDNILKHLGIDFVVFRAFLFQSGKLTALLAKGYRGTALSPGITALLEGSIIQVPASIKGMRQDSRLNLRWIEPVFETLAHLSSLLCLDILADCLIRDIARRRDEITVCPQGRQSQERGELTPEIERTAPFESLHQLVHGHLRRARDEQVQMVWLYLKCQYLNLLLFSYASNNGVQSLFNIPHEHLPSTLGAPDEMIVDEIDLIRRMLIFHSVYSIAQINITVNLLGKEEGSFIPSFEKRGFLSRFCKET